MTTDGRYRLSPASDSSRPGRILIIWESSAGQVARPSAYHRLWKAATDSARVIIVRGTIVFIKSDRIADLITENYQERKL